MPTNNSTTLTQRRKSPSTSSRVRNLNRDKLSDNPDQNLEKTNSPLKALVWFMVIILLAFITYWGFKTYVVSDTDRDAQISPTPVLTSNSIVALNTLPDDPVADFDDEEFWNTEAKQIVSSEPDQDYVIETVVVQPYESYLSFIYEVTGGDGNSFPQTTASISNNEINIELEAITLNNSLFEENETVEISSEMVESITRSSFESDIDNYMIALISEEPFALYSKVEEDRKYVVIDVLRPEQEPTVEPTETGIEPTTTPDDQSRNSETKSVEGNATGNNVRITGYNFADSLDKFTYNIVLDVAYPDATAELNGNTLVLEVNQVGFDGIVGNGGSGTTDLAATGVVNVSEVVVENANNTTTFTFTITNPDGFELILDESESILRLEINR